MKYKAVLGPLMHKILSQRNMLYSYTYVFLVFWLGCLHIFSGEVLTILFVLFLPIVLILSFIKYFYFVVQADKIVVRSSLPMVNFFLDKEKIVSILEGDFSQISIPLSRWMKKPEKPIIIKYKEFRGAEFIVRDMWFEIVDKKQNENFLKELESSGFPVYRSTRVEIKNVVSSI